MAVVRDFLFHFHAVRFTSGGFPLIFKTVVAMARLDILPAEYYFLLTGRYSINRLSCCTFAELLAVLHVESSAGVAFGGLLDPWHSAM